MASTPQAYTTALLALESVLSDPHLQPAPLSSAWVATWQQRWRASLAACGPSGLEGLLLHLAMLGQHVVLGEYAMARDGFLRILNNCR